MIDRMVDQLRVRVPVIPDTSRRLVVTSVLSARAIDIITE